MKSEAAQATEPVAEPKSVAQSIATETTETTKTTKTVKTEVTQAEAELGEHGWQRSHNESENERLKQKQSACNTYTLIHLYTYSYATQFTYGKLHNDALSLAQQTVVELTPWCLFIRMVMLC